jgi:hypothetical protein
MKRFTIACALLAMIATGAYATSTRATHAHRHAAVRAYAVRPIATLAASGSASCAGTSCTKSSCPFGASSTSARASSVTSVVPALNGASMSHGVCPVSDPSRCPASCRRDGAAATVAVNTTAR